MRIFVCLIVLLTQISITAIPNYPFPQNIVYPFGIKPASINSDRIWKYYKSFLNSNGLMHWKVAGFNDIVGMNAATDAEMDVAAALLSGNMPDLWNSPAHITRNEAAQPDKPSDGAPELSLISDGNFRYMVPHDGIATLDIHSLQGKLIICPFNGYLQTGMHTALLPVGNGMCLVTLRTTSGKYARKFTVNSRLEQFIAIIHYESCHSLLV